MLQRAFETKVTISLLVITWLTISNMSDMQGKKGHADENYTKINVQELI